MRFYLAHQIADAAEPHRAFLAIILSVISVRYALFPSSSAVFYVSLFWLINWLLGASLALIKREWSTSRATKSVSRWCLWMISLAIGWGFHDADPGAGDYIFRAINIILMLTEGSRTFKLLAYWAKHLGIDGADRLLSFFATATSDEVEHLKLELGKLRQQQSVNMESIGENRLTIKDLTEHPAASPVIVNVLTGGANTTATVQSNEPPDQPESENQSNGDLL